MIRRSSYVSANTTTSGEKESKMKDEKDVQAPVESTLSLGSRCYIVGLVIFMSFGPEYSRSINGSLKSTLKSKLDINNSQFGVISSASDLINTILPIVGGFLVDQFGICSSTITCMLFILLGNIIDSIGATADHYQTFVGGGIVFGIGQSVLETAQRKLYYQMFPNRGLALVYAIDLGFVRICNILGKVTALPIANARGYAMSYWMSVVFTALSLTANLIVVFFMSKRNRIDCKVVFDKDTTKIHRILMTLPSGFFLFAVSWIFQPSVFSTFNKIVADLVKVHYNVSVEQGGYYSALTQVIPVVMTPLGGVFVDLYGRRPQFVPVAAGLYIIVYALIAKTSVHPILPLILSSIAFSLSTISLLASIPLIIHNDKYLGLALGIWKSFINCGDVIMSVVVGRVQDITPNESYVNVIWIFMGVKAWAVVLGVVYIIVDRVYCMKIFDRSVNSRVKLEADLGCSIFVASRLSWVNRYVNCLCVFFYGAFVVAAWVTFFYFYKN
ncbi:MFS general substrate transporter [Wallemia mellicola]|uniref:Lysosomal dipeptide transporter MFSD1 n=1 Tax=Wallemia mellicola TaxID=1708541 RepID=A0A4T0LT67_9BASI|nr:MFS general substrate transporter [Wallemia mellicola]